MTFYELLNINMLPPRPSSISRSNKQNLFRVAILFWLWKGISNDIVDKPLFHPLTTLIATDFSSHFYGY